VFSSAQLGTSQRSVVPAGSAYNAPPEAPADLSALKKRHSVLSAFPMFVPSLPW